MPDSTTHGFPREVYEKYKRDGFSDAEIEQIWKDREVMVKLYFSNPEKQPREITSSTYERSQRAMDKDVKNWFGRM